MEILGLIEPGVILVGAIFIAGSVLDNLRDWLKSILDKE